MIMYVHFHVWLQIISGLATLDMMFYTIDSQIILGTDITGDELPQLVDCCLSVSVSVCEFALDIHVYNAHLVCWGLSKNTT